MRLEFSLFEHLCLYTLEVKLKDGRLIRTIGSVWVRNRDLRRRLKDVIEDSIDRGTRNNVSAGLFNIEDVEESLIINFNPLIKVFKPTIIVRV